MSLKTLFHLAIWLENAGISVKGVKYIRIAGNTHSIISLKSGANLLPETVLKMEKFL